MSSLSTQADDANTWALAKEVDGITLYTRITGGAPVKAVKAVMLVDSTINSAAALIMDVAAAPQWKYSLESAEIIKTDGPQDVWVHSVVAMPWPLSNRDSVNEMKLSRSSQDGSVTIEMINRPESLPLEKKVIRMPVAEGHWLLKPQSGDRVEITLEYTGNPGGKIPDWVLNMFILEGPIKTFQAMRGLLEQPKYRDAHPATVDG